MKVDSPKHEQTALVRVNVVWLCALLVLVGMQCAAKLAGARMGEWVVQDDVK